MMPKELENHPKIDHSTRLRDLKIRYSDFRFEKVGEKSVALKVGEKAVSHLTPLYAPAHASSLTNCLTSPVVTIQPPRINLSLGVKVVYWSEGR